jgi:triphosphoribosyl-dephospho-CoA synthase
VTLLERAPSSVPLQAADVAIAAQLACLLEASAPKPGNVSPGRHFDDLRYEDFLASAAAIGAPLAGAGTRPVGATIHLAVEATARWTRSNSNLGIVLLLAPLAKAALESTDASTVRLKADTTPSPVVSGFSRTLREAVDRVLAETTIDDAREVYAAIRRAAPGGLGRVDDQDVADEPTQALVDVMRLAADRDGIAREYATGFEMRGRGVTASPGMWPRSRRFSPCLRPRPTHTSPAEAAWRWRQTCRGRPAPRSPPAACARRPVER